MADAFFTVKRTNDAHVVDLRLPDLVDPLELDQVNEELLAAIASDPGGAWVLDLAGTTYMGSAVLGLMVNVRQRVKQGGGRLALCSMSPRLLSVFQACSLERLFVIKSDRRQATAAVGG